MGLACRRRMNRSCFSRSSRRKRSARAPALACRSVTASSIRTAGRSGISATIGVARSSTSSCRMQILARCRGRIRLKPPSSPMTERLYCTNAYLRTFDESVQRVDGNAVTLDRTAFYPTTGGQPFDTGTLNGRRVVDVIDNDDGSIAHVLEAEPTFGRSVEGPGLTPGAAVHGEIDWTRRFDHMQQHTGQHVLSAAFSRLVDVRTVSFHLGAEVSTIDLAREMSANEITAAATEANRVVWENRPVAIKFGR